jgi:hypothetical protein
VGSDQGAALDIEADEQFVHGLLAKAIRVRFRRSPVPPDTAAIAALVRDRPARCQPLCTRREFIQYLLEVAKSAGQTVLLSSRIVTDARTPAIGSPFGASGRLASILGLAEVGIRPSAGIVREPA